MTIYKTIALTELWTKIGSTTGLKPPVDTLLEISGPYWLRERDLQTWLIAAPVAPLSYPETWVGKCVEQAACELYVPPEPPPTVPPMPPPEVAFRWRDAAGNIVIEETYVKKSP